jgi:hypothetical protein
MKKLSRNTYNIKDEKIQVKRSLYSAFRATRYHGRKPVEVHHSNHACPLLVETYSLMAGELKRAA